VIVIKVSVGGFAMKWHQVFCNKTPSESFASRYVFLVKDDLNVGR